MKQYNISVLVEEGPFDTSLAEVRKNKGEIVSAKELAKLRMLGGPEHYVSQNGSWTSENYNYFPDGAIVIAKAANNPILQNPKVATDAHRVGEEFYLDEKTVEALREYASSDIAEAVKRGALLVKRNNVKGNYVPESFGDELVPRFLFGDEAQRYGAWLKDQGIKQVPHYVAGKANQPFARGFWLGSLGVGSNMYGYNNLVYFNGCVVGVRRGQVIVPAERAAPTAGLDELVK